MDKENYVTTEKILREAINLISKIEFAQQKNREKSKEEYGSLLDAHLMATGVIASVLKRNETIVGKTNERITGRLALLASFIHGIKVTYIYDHGTVHLLAYWAFWKSGELVLTDHDDFRWVSVAEMDQFEFAPADVPLVEKLRRDKHEF